MQKTKHKNYLYKEGQALNAKNLLYSLMQAAQYPALQLITVSHENISPNYI
jgi:hypothetical protein